MHLADRDRERPVRTPRLLSPPPVRNGPKVTANEAAYITPDQVRLLLAASKEADTHHSPRCSSTAACGEVKRSPSTGPTLILTPSCSGYVGTLARVDGELVVTETKTAKSRRVVPLSPTAERALRDVRNRQRAERLMAGSLWQPPRTCSQPSWASPAILATRYGR